LLVVARLPSALDAQASPFPVPAGLPGAVNLWKQAFTRHSYGEVILFDPLGPATIFSVVRLPDSEQGRALVGNERARIAVSKAAKDPVAVRTKEQVVNVLIARRLLVVSTRCVGPFAQFLIA